MAFNKKDDPVALQAYVTLMTKHQANLRAFIVSLMPGSRDVDDVLQDTNAVLWQKRARFEDQPIPDLPRQIMEGLVERQGRGGSLPAEASREGLVSPPAGWVEEEDLQAESLLSSARVCGCL